MNTTTHTTAPAAPTFTFDHTPHTLYAREDINASADRVITITTSLAGVIIAIVGLILGYIYWKHPKKASLKTLPMDNPSPLPRSVDARPVLWLAFPMQFVMAPVRPAPAERESDPELARVSTIHSEPEDAVEFEPVR
ncbi:uncharacterized protein H6S33_003291 [Morchella sextelata]|uniref:uncharacterized protein n=1 Tax=Morchella sextelata TaxID=1174677 RepID=UPI001D0458A0|nr:uncharacterized protein H6S33_003291 [Morchella sextelata]KAH0607303.1 hypothetical protein H6S33_003291 [Morchella sextelata]